jgi:hypothetical protein
MALSFMAATGGKRLQRSHAEYLRTARGMYRFIVPTIRSRMAWPLALLVGACTAAIPRAPPAATPPAVSTLAAPVATAASSPAANLREPSASSVSYCPPPPTKGSAFTVRGPLPDPTFTPGAVMTTDMTVVCQHSTKERRRVSSEVHREAFAEYGLSYPQARGAFEVDHLIPLELSGDNTIANLWPEAAEPVPGFHEKDRVENFLHKQVCSGAMRLADAQRQIATDWIAVWRRIEGQAATTDGREDEGD